MNCFLISIFLPIVWAQFNTNPFGQFSNTGNNPFAGSNNQQIPQSSNPVQQPAFGIRIPQDYVQLNTNNYKYSSGQFPIRRRYKCPKYWIYFGDSCYRFIKSPKKSRYEASTHCQASYGSSLASINSLHEYGFLNNQLMWRDPQRYKWYFGGKKVEQSWLNEYDGSLMVSNPDQFDFSKIKPGHLEYLVFSYSSTLRRWMYEVVDGSEKYPFICEIPLSDVAFIIEDDERTQEYGITVDDPEKVPRGPRFIKQPEDTIFDVTNVKVTNDVTLSCSADGYPAPTYEWYKEEYENDVTASVKINPLTDKRYTISGGNLIISDPKQFGDGGSYHCKAINKFGSILSESITLAFGFIGEFNLQRSPESGNQNWGKAIYCDPPPHFPDVNYKWTRDYFPNFVEEDRRLFVSFDGALYFSALQEIDRGNYSCTAQTKQYSIGRTGPFFRLNVNPNPNYQQLKFPNNFPKVFPEAPIAGKDIRLECFAFGYPVPSYNWTRKGAPLPRRAVFSNYNRVLTLPDASVEDQGEYVCRASNERSAIENGVFVTIQAEPNFTIPLEDKHLDAQTDLVWNCEAFGVPDVNYTWFRNGEILNPQNLPPQDRDRYFVQDNVLRIKQLDKRRDAGMYQCRASNQLKTRYSSAQLRVLAFKPRFDKHPLEAEMYAAENKNVTIKCNPEAAPKPKFVWKLGDRIIGSGGRRQILENGDLFISPVSTEDEGAYTCIASNNYGRDESRGLLIVLRTPKMYKGLPPNVTRSWYDDLTLECVDVAEEILDTAYIWTHNGIKIRDRDIKSGHMVPDGGILNVYNISFADAGEYKCTIRSSVGEISSQTILTVHGPPGPPGGVQVTSITSSSATIQWSDGVDNGEPILFYNIGARTNWNSTWVNITGLIKAREIDRYNGRKEAIVENVLSPWSVYEFRVLAVNKIGPGTPSEPSPQYSTPPDSPNKPPSNIGGGGGKIGDLTLTWTPLPPEDQNAPGIYYKIFWRRSGSNREFQSKELKENGNSGSAVVRIEPEYYFTKYDIKVQAINSIGKGPESAIVTIYSAEEMPLAAPQQVSARSYNSTSLNVTWTPLELKREIIRGNLIGHRLKYWKVTQPEYEAVYYLSRSIRPWALVVGLQPDTQYNVKVMAYNNAGEGPESEKFTERTYRKPPQKPPSSVHVLGLNPSTIKVVWRYVAPGPDEEPLIGYKIRIWEVDQDMAAANDTIIPVGSKLEAYISTLTPGKQYHLRVLAYSLGGDGRMSSPTHTFQMGPTLAKTNSQPILLPNTVVFFFTLFTVYMINRE